MEKIKLKKPQYFNFSECLWFLDRDYDDCLHRVDDRSVKKLLRIDENQFLIEVSDSKEELIISLLRGNPSDSEKEIIAGFVSDWFDLERDISPFYKIREGEELFNAYKGLRLIGIPNFFEAMCWSIIGQQINLTFAYSLKRRLVELCGTSMEYEDTFYYGFPTPEEILKLSIEDLRDKQFSQRKAEYILGIAQQFVDGTINKSYLSSLSNTEEMVIELCKTRGIGEWSANYILMKSLKRLDCITHGDTGLQAAVKRELKLDRKPTREEIISFLKPFEGWFSYVIIYLWRSFS